MIEKRTRERGRRPREIENNGQRDRDEGKNEIDSHSTKQMDSGKAIRENMENTARVLQHVCVCVRGCGACSEFVGIRERERQKTVAVRLFYTQIVCRPCC